MTKTNWLLVGALAAMILMQAVTAAQRDKYKSRALFFAGLYSGVLIGTGCEPGLPDEGPLIEEAPERAIPQALRL